MDLQFLDHFPLHTPPKLPLPTIPVTALLPLPQPCAQIHILPFKSPPFGQDVVSE